MVKEMGALEVAVREEDVALKITGGTVRADEKIQVGDEGQGR